MNRTRQSLCLGILMSVALIIGAAQRVRAQGTAASSDVGIDEKLGAQAALDAQLRDEDGNIVTLRQLIDKPTILVLNYFRCAGICPLLLNGVAEVLNQASIEPGKDYQVVAVSFDPTDTPEMAKEKQRNYLKLMKRPFPPQAWHFLTGDAAGSKAVADSVGFEYRAVGDMYVHPGAIIILTPQGIVSRYMYGTTFLPADLEMAVQEAAAGAVRPTISRILAFCYSYDPEGRRYVFSITRVVGATTLLFGGGFLLYLVLTGRSRKGKDKERLSA